MDKRVLKTKTALTDALFELLETKEIADISVTELCEKADVNRRTFYIHYSNVDDIFEDYENELSEQVYQTMKNANGDIETLLDTFDSILSSNFQGFKQLCLNQKHHALIDRLQRMLFHTLEDSLLVDNPSANDQLVLQYLSSGLINSYIYWFEHPDKMSYQELAIINKEIIQANLTILK